jgi:hypothetical protein
MELQNLLDSLDETPDGDIKLINQWIKSTHRLGEDVITAAHFRRGILPPPPQRLDKKTLVLFTNRLSIWRFFERFVSVTVKESGAHWKNPFDEFGKDFLRIFNGWRPIMISEVNRHLDKNGGRHQLFDDMMSMATAAFLETLERQAMDLLAMSKKAQLIPFHLKLRYAIQRHVHQGLPDLVGGGVRIGFDSKAFKEDRPVFIPFEDYMRGVEGEDDD